ncbi:MAG: alanine racemase [Chloroflexi bacterium]|nr:alanine racemase [Chloroflexota bacterium]MCY3581133.1 alanine racemase [Chloroflexota bacterium]MCY3715590.1 alanine racemase [Chloroflexota bacterium]MDE2650672.1 alanine racemase [Chloroflexota bacterium]
MRGQAIAVLETPSVLIDMDIMERNIARMQARCDQLGISFRPHIKTHKIPDIARRQLAAGAVGIACQKVSEAEVFAAAGFRDIQIPYNIVGARKTGRLAQLARKVKLSVTVDSRAVVDGIAAAAQKADAHIDMLVELVSLGERTGTTPADALSLAQHIAATDNLGFAGLMIYPSDAAIRPRLLETLNLLAAAGIPVAVISGGGSGAIREAHLLPELTEMRVGTYVFYDWNSVSQGYTTFENCAMRLRATVVSAHEASRVILDAGSKSIHSETVNGRFGYIEEFPAARLRQVNEEHGYVDFSACPSTPAVGDILHIIPVHTCVVTNLHNQVYGVRGGMIEQVWDVAARGLVW